MPNYRMLVLILGLARRHFTGWMKEPGQGTERAGKLVPQSDRKTDPETLARTANAEPWEPLPGMVKRQCV